MKVMCLHAKSVRSTKQQGAFTARQFLMQLRGFQSMMKFCSMQDLLTSVTEPQLP